MRVIDESAPGAHPSEVADSPRRTVPFPSARLWVISAAAASARSRASRIAGGSAARRGRPRCRRSWRSSGVARAASSVGVAAADAARASAVSLATRARCVAVCRGGDVDDRSRRLPATPGGSSATSSSASTSSSGSFISVQKFSSYPRECDSRSAQLSEETRTQDHRTSCTLPRTTVTRVGRTWSQPRPCRRPSARASGGSLGCDPLGGRIF